MEMPINSVTIMLMLMGWGGWVASFLEWWKSDSFLYTRT